MTLPDHIVLLYEFEDFFMMEVLTPAPSTKRKSWMAWNGWPGCCARWSEEGILLESKSIGPEFPDARKPGPISKRRSREDQASKK